MFSDLIFLVFKNTFNEAINKNFDMPNVPDRDKI